MNIEPSPIDEIEAKIESGIGDLYCAFYKLRESGQYQREYDTMQVILGMLARDSQELRVRYKVKF